MTQISRIRLFDANGYVVGGYDVTPRPPQPIFEIYGRDGRAWKIHENGVIEGFEEGCLIVNRIAPKLAALRGGGNG